MPQIECPVCTLFLREGMTLTKHLHTHPKAQVIMALARMAGENSEPSVRSIKSAHTLRKITYPQLPSLEPIPPAVPSPSNNMPSMEPPQLTSILYHQQFLSSTTTSFVDPSCLPPPPQLIMMGPAPTTINSIGATNPTADLSPSVLALLPPNRLTHLTGDNRPSSNDHSDQQPDIIDSNMQNHMDISYPAVSGCNTSSSNTVNIGCQSSVDQSTAFQYPQLDNLNFQRHSQNSCPPIITESVVHMKDNETDKEVMNIGTVITDSQKIISNSPLSASLFIDHNKPENGDLMPNSPGSASSSYSVRVRQDLRTPSCSPPRDEYILPGFVFEADEDDNSQAVDDSGHSVPLNIHTDESMPPRGELSGHGTNSNSMWQANEVDRQPNSHCEMRNQVGTELWEDNIEDGVHIHPDTEDGISVIRRENRDSQESLLQFTTTSVQRGIGVSVQESTDARLQEPFSRVFIKPKNEQCSILKDEIGTIKLDDISIKEDTDGKKAEVKTPRRKIRTCRTCNQVFPTNEEFRNHIRRVHPLECKACGKCFLRASGLTLHQKRHLKIKPYKCTFCEKTFVTNQKLTEHHNTHTGDSPFKCMACNRTFKRYSNLIQHKKTVHLKVKRKVKDFVCTCGEVFHSQLKLNWHKEKHDGQPKKCSYCSERFVHTSSLTRHIRRSHDQLYIPTTDKVKSEKENVECPICQRVCLKGSLRNHLLVHSGVKPFSCNICGKRFFSKWNMKLHLWTHASRSSLPYKCKLKPCKAAFVRESDYQAHLRSHRNQRQYSCNYCGRQFIRKYNCIRHTREHEISKTYSCNICGKKFHRGYYLTEHMRIHTGVKPFTCHICSKTTATKTNHNKHLKTHHAREIIASEN